MNLPSTIADPAAEARLKRVVRRIQDLPSFPRVIKKLMEVAENPNSSSKDLALVMENDQGLAGKILKLVNSAFYSFSKPVASLQHAVTLIGYNTIRSLAMSVSVKGMFKELGKGFDLEAYWSHSLATAIGAKLLADRNRLPYKDDLFTAGLLHDVGVLLEARYFPDELDLVLEAISGGRPILEAEHDYMGVTHCLLGCWLAEQWRLPRSLSDSILLHHEMLAGPPETPGDPEIERMVKCVTIANRAALALGFTYHYHLEKHPPGERTRAPLELPAHLTDLLSPDAFEEFLDQITAEFENSKEFLKL